MPVSAFSVLSEPTRRRIVDRLREAECSVTELVEVLGVSQPTMSKHLRVLKEGGFVTSRTEAQRRIYRIHARPFQELDDWLQPYRALWDRHLDALEHHLDHLEES
jgi:DNA-binding transcriptional ArsR family regulator